ncbi:hypothetical protein F4809DRAFT_644129 [Biscogniauxia mediterranea]|nr:hypothetical protein F4809DRAFT_644129 [Biscogniauxia mediterranea]
MANNTNDPDRKRPVDDHTSSCTHSDSRNLPVCWDCAEEGHVKQKFDALPSSPTWENFKRITKGLRLPQQHQHHHHPHHHKIPLSSAAPEVHPPEEGIEVFHGKQQQQQQQAGLEVVAGPRVANPEDKFRRVIPVVVVASDEKKAVAGEGEPRISDSRDRDDDEGGEGEKKKEKEEEAGRRIYGLRRRTFWAVVACALLVLVAVVLGVAVGVTQRNRAMQSTALSVSSNADQGVSSHPSSSSSLSALVTTETMYMTASDGGGGGGDSGGENTATSSSPSPSTPTTTTTAAAAGNTNTNTPSPSPSPSPSSSTTSPPSPSPSCLGADGSTYTDAATRSQFRIECDTAHQGKDIVNREAASMEACVALCAGDDACRGAIWYDAGPQGTDLNYCWLKSAMGDERRETRDAQSVVRL